MSFFFAWVGETETTFGPEHHVEDEQVFSFAVSHAEGDFPALEVAILNPRVGFLAPGRRQWAWLSWRRGPGDVVPLFLGRLIGVPQALQESIVTLHFLARPRDYREQKEVLAEALRVLPWYDPVFLDEEARRDPERVLDARPAVWHIDRVTHQVTVSDIAFGEDGAVAFDAGEVFRDSVQVSHGQSPARRCVVEAAVTWDQTASGSLDLTNRLVREFGTRTPAIVSTIDGQDRLTHGLVVIAAGEELLRAWPETGKAIGGGWSVGESLIGVVGPEPTTMTLHNESDFLELARLVAEGEPVAAISFGRTPGLAAPIEPSTQMWSGYGPPFGFFSPKKTVLWIPLWRFAASLELDWTAARARTERIAFTVDADVQPLLTDAGEEEEIRISVPQSPVDREPEAAVATEGEEPAIGDPARPSYFKTDRGRDSLAYLIALARAHLLARARAVDVAFEVPFAAAVDLSCRKSASIADPRLPGGQAAGKIKSYALTADGGSGRMVGQVVIGCMVGRDGEVEIEPGDPVWCEAGYVADGYQHRDGAVHVPLAGDIGYEDYTAAPIDDDGVDLDRVTLSRHLRSLAVTGGFTTEKEEVEKVVFLGPTRFRAKTVTEVLDVLSTAYTSVRVEMAPVSGGPFDTLIEPAMTGLKVPKTIDLESA